MLCDNVGIINQGNLVAYDTPQGLKDSLLEDNKSQIKDALSKLPADSDNNLALTKMSVLLKDKNSDLISKLESLGDVKSVELEKNGRINLRVDTLNDMAVHNVFKCLVSSGEVIKSVYSFVCYFI